MISYSFGKQTRHWRTTPNFIVSNVKFQGLHLPVGKLTGYLLVREMPKTSPNRSCERIAILSHLLLQDFWKAIEFLKVSLRTMLHGIGWLPSGWTALPGWLGRGHPTLAQKHQILHFVEPIIDIAPENRPSPNTKVYSIVFQPSIFRCFWC